MTAAIIPFPSRTRVCGFRAGDHVLIDGIGPAVFLELLPCEGDRIAVVRDDLNDLDVWLVQVSRLQLTPKSRGERA
jgi:hypothetical protein